MRKLVMKSLAALLALALLLTVLPATATTAKAADVSSDGYVIFEETFDTDANGNLKSGNTFSKTGNTHTIANGLLTFAAGNNRHYLDFVLSDLAIPVLTSNRCYVALKVELIVHESTASNRRASIQLLETKDASGTSITSFTKIQNDITGILNASGGVAIGYANKKIDSMKVRVGARDDGASGGAVVIEGVRISLILGELEGKTAAAQDMGRFLDVQDGFFQLNRDMTFNSYTLASDNSVETDLIMGGNAVLDLNGKTLTIAEGSSLKVPAGAKIVDTSAEKTGKIVCAEDALTITNTAHSTLPLRTADGYVFAEPSLIAGTHIFVDGEQTADAFTLHFRPGFGTLGGVNVRETYLAGGNSGIQMTANITSVDIYGNETKLQYEGSEDILLDDVFNGMYASQNARGKMTFQGFEKYQALKITLKLSADGVTCTLPTYTVNNTKVTTHYASQFNYKSGYTQADYGITQGNFSVSEAGKLNYEGGTILFTLQNAVTTGANKTMVLEFDATAATNAVRASFETRGTSSNGSNRYSVFAANYYGTHHKLLPMDPFTGTQHVRMEINLETFTANYSVDGEARTPVSVAEADLQNYINAWNNAAALVLANNGGVGASTPFTVDNLMLYTIAS